MSDENFKYAWSSDEFSTTNWTYTVSKPTPTQFRVLGIVKRALTDSGKQLHHYHAFEHVQRTNMFFPTLAEAKAWVVACTMGAKP